MIKFTVFGKPCPMGSKKAFVIGKRAIITDVKSDKRKQWANAVSTVAADVMSGRELITSPIVLTVRFYFARPSAHYGSGKNAGTRKASAPEFHSQSPDLDKLLRCLGDAMTGVVYRDDRQIFSIESSRHWTESQERAEITVSFQGDST